MGTLVIVRFLAAARAPHPNQYRDAACKSDITAGHLRRQIRLEVRVSICRQPTAQLHQRGNQPHNEPRASPSSRHPMHISLLPRKDMRPA